MNARNTTARLNTLSKLTAAAFEKACQKAGVAYTKGKRVTMIDAILRKESKGKAKGEGATKGRKPAEYDVDGILAQLAEGVDRATSKKLRRQLRTAGHTGGVRSLAEAA